MSKIAVLGAGRWGSLIAWYTNKIGHNIVLWGRKESKNFQNLKKNRSNSLLKLDDKIEITSDLDFALLQDYLIVSINSQNFRNFLNDLIKFCENKFDLNKKKIIMCMKGIEENTGKRLSEIVKEFLPDHQYVAIWVGPGHVKNLLVGIPTCMVVDSDNLNFKNELCKMFSSSLIKCYKGNDLIGNEIGAAAKNVLGIGAGILDALKMESLKGPLMSIGAQEIASIIEVFGGNYKSAFGLCHLGDFQATLFSKESNNRKFGESIVTGEKIYFVSEGIKTANAIYRICKEKKLKLPICEEIYMIINKKIRPEESIKKLFSSNIE
ncbi:MAG: glycerol-3-phosphate dehydrogenase [Firmicutes bacterium]|nr:glycerol-3-phosphate dehydrogenase [Bacillota bacterium]